MSAARRRLFRFWRPDVDADVDDEIQLHLAMRTEELAEAGWTPAAARAEALRAFGDIERVRSGCRQIGRQEERRMRLHTWMDEARQDVRFALRQFGRIPGFTAVALLTLALGIGATTAIFSAVHAVVLAPLPFEDPSRIAQVYGWRWEQPSEVSAGNFVDWRRDNEVFDPLVAANWTSLNLADDGRPERVLGSRVSRGYFRLFGVAPLLGRVLLDEEDAPGREHVVVLSHRLWTRRYGADASIVGRDVRLNDVPHTVVGVMPPSFDYLSEREELWVPIAFTPEREAMHDEHYLDVKGRLRDGVSFEQAQAHMNAIAKEQQRRFPDENTGLEIRVEPFARVLIGDARERLLTWLGAVFCVLLIACGNVASLLLARGATRSRELALRAALGAGRSRVVRQLLTESLLLGAGGAAGGLLLAHAGVAVLTGAGPGDVPRLEQARVEWITLGFAILLGLLSSVVFGLAPAIRAARVDLQGSLKEGRRSSALAVRDRARSWLVAGEVALALTLLVSAGLLVRNALALQRVDVGFRPQGVLTARVTLPAASYEEPAQLEQAFEQMIDTLRRAPGVAAAGASSQVPMGPGGNFNGLIPEGRPMEIASAIQSRLRMVTPGYFEAMGITLRRGRLFTPDDRRGTPRVMVVSETLAREAWPGQDPIGKRMLCCEGAPDDPRWKTIVGVVTDVRSNGPGAPAGPEFYLPIRQIPPEAWGWTERSLMVAVRAAGGNPEALAPAVRDAVASVDRAVPVYALATMEQRMMQSMAQARFNTLLLTSLGVLGLVLAAVGIYGVIAYFVSQRMQELGVRMALGATARDVLRLVLGQAMRPVAVGLVLGSLSAAASARLLRSQLTGVGHEDPVAFLAGVALLLAAAGIASVLPARRAARVDPARVLQEG